MMARGWDLFPSWLWVAYCLAYTGATAGLALWSRQGGGLGRRPWWRAGVVVLLRLEVFFLPLNRCGGLRRRVGLQCCMRWAGRQEAGASEGQVVGLR